MNYQEMIIKKLTMSNNVFLTGGAGVGKTTLTNQIIKYFESEAKKVVKLASTGMAATLIGGQTLHSFFDLGIVPNLEELEKKGKLETPKKVKRLIQSMDLLIIDEISMVSDALLEMVEYRLISSEFSGAILVVGDFLQLPPITRSFNEVRFAFESSAWERFDFFTVELTHIYRTRDTHFIELLNSVRFGQIDEQKHNQLNEYIKPIPECLNEFTFLFGKNISASLHNKKQLSFIDSELFIKEAQIVKHKKSAKESEVERFMNDARIDRKLELKIGSPVLFTRNSWNYFNGERGTIVNIDHSYVYVQKSDNKLVKLEAVAQSKSEWKEVSISGKKELVEENVFSIYQFPIKLAFAITIHKSQGMSIEDLIIETNEIFAPSQFYVALSRSSNPSRLNLIAPSKQWYDLAFVNPKAMEFVKQTS